MKSELLFKSDSKDARGKRRTEDYFQRSGTLEEEGKGRGRGGKKSGRGMLCWEGERREREVEGGGILVGLWYFVFFYYLFCFVFVWCARIIENVFVVYCLIFDWYLLI